jgi:hypothetical protein
MSNNVWTQHSQLKAGLPCIGYEIADIPFYSDNRVIKWTLWTKNCPIPDTLIYHARDKSWELQTDPKSPTGNSHQLLHILTMAGIVADSWKITD